MDELQSPTGAPNASSGDPLQRLVVLERLSVGPPRVEKRAIRAQIRIEHRGQLAQTELAFRYDEDVFDPESSADANLAALILAQPMLNYGLFFRDIRFAGPFDHHDRRFLADAARNTAKEIYVNKLLAENPYLVAPATQPPIIRRKSYLLSALDFGPAQRFQASEPWSGSQGRRTAVLSSGGKESLLSFGLLSELGLKVDPIFVNESGRHWFTALTSYRYFSDHVESTARIWTDVDRFFGWMLRQLPIVRPDFARLRADFYPLRLWTVGIFVFAALPILRARGCSRLVIGNEHDTTSRTRTRGITHYAGLYDQSRYFDNALTRFFRQKGFDVLQFSLLRPLSELLVQKTLAERYPQLFELQVSCHAARAESGQRILPCGRCEKCRRVVAMLTAIDHDPRRLGYDDQAITRCLDSLQEDPPHHERPIIEHLASVLAEKGHLPSPRIARVKGRRRHDVLALRYDAERSPLDTIPVDLREPLTRILLEHADGALQRQGGQQVPVNPLSPDWLTQPYPMTGPPTAGEDAASQREARSAAGCDPRDQRHLLGQLTWPEARARLAEVDIALLPVGALEQHGLHLPLDTDAFDADTLARQVADACDPPAPLVLPLIGYGVSYHHDDFPGTVSISPEVLSQLVYEIGISVARQGIVKLVIINGHGGNEPALHFAAQKINRDAKIFIAVDSGESSDTDIERLCTTRNDVHAGEIETSTALFLRPELVDLAAAEANVPRFSSRYLDFSSKRAVGWYAYTKRLSSTGTLGDPTCATAEKGAQIWQLVVEHLVCFVNELKNLSLDEIYQRRY
jgi:creatinine amidohydrolase/Fe(II)-dependent formamide hydrolase-like protein/7-cyano-7-deazaguanine synthase in queuosine biosynthesis